jgi:hypothetical protein
MRRAILGGMVCLLTVGCLPRERLNAACEWTADTTVLPPPGDPARRAHLIEDVRVAEDLGIRYGDARGGRVWSDTNRRERAWCTTASLEEIMRLHHVSQAEITAVTGARELWIDLLAVFLPMAALFLVASRQVAKRIIAGYDPEDRVIALAVLGILTPVIAGLALGMADMWGWIVEMLRTRNDHISYRAFQLPTSRHGWLVWGIAMGLFAAIAARELLRKGEGTRGERRVLRFSEARVELTFPVSADSAAPESSASASASE